MYVLYIIHGFSKVWITSVSLFKAECLYYEVSYQGTPGYYVLCLLTLEFHRIEIRRNDRLSAAQ